VLVVDRQVIRCSGLWAKHRTYCHVQGTPTMLGRVMIAMQLAFNGNVSYHTLERHSGTKLLGVSTTLAKILPTRSYPYP